MSPTNDIVAGLAELIAGTGIAVWRPNGVYTAAETGITVAMMPPGPDRGLTLTAYPVADGPLTAAVMGVQIRVRAGRDPRDVQALADDLYDLLHRRESTVLHGVKVPLIWRQSQAWLGADANGRQELTANYYMQVSRPSGAHLDD